MVALRHRDWTRWSYEVYVKDDADGTENLVVGPMYHSRDQMSSEKGSKAKPICSNKNRATMGIGTYRCTLFSWAGGSFVVF
jgi:hypothetical protein